MSSKIEFQIWAAKLKSQIEIDKNWSANFEYKKTWKKLNSWLKVCKKKLYWMSKGGAEKPLYVMQHLKNMSPEPI